MIAEYTAYQIQRIVAAHEAWRSGCMNLCAAENALSPQVKAQLATDLVQRYGNFAGRDLANRRYQGTRYIQELEEAVTRIVQESFGASEVELRAVSGHVAGLCVIMGLCRPGDTVLELSGADGGHRLAAKAVGAPLIDLNVGALPFDADAFTVDAAAACELIVAAQPRLVILGSSNFLFPHPVGEIAECLAQSPDTVLAYDASHVMGLLACGMFQKPLEEGAHVVFGSTHKTLPGPQGGLIFSDDPALMDAISLAVYPGVVTNHHLTRGPALALALLEMRANPGYGAQVVANARALGAALVKEGLAVVGSARGFTESHTVLVQVSQFGSGLEVATLLELADIITSHASLPSALGGEGVRLGTSEVTRLGATEAQMQSAARIIAGLLLDRTSIEGTASAVHEWASSLPGLTYTAMAAV